MNFSLIAFLLGRLSLALSAILLLPVGLAIFMKTVLFVEFAITSFTAFFVGLGFVQYGKFDEKRKILSLREGFATVVFSWILTCIICALPYAFLQILDLSQLFLKVCLVSLLLELQLLLIWQPYQKQFLFLAQFYALVGWYWYHCTVYCFTASGSRRICTSF